jgi:plastocyanin
MRTLHKTLIAIAVVAALVALVGCSGSGSGTSGTGSTGGTSGGTAPAAGGTSAVAVSLQNFAFNPSTIDVAVGGTVTFTNNDSATHDVVGDSFDSGPMAQGATFSQKFPTAGTFPIHCSIHPSMTATVNVK